MSNILDYILWRGDLSFDVSPLNEVDNLIFSKLAYLDFTNLINHGTTTLAELSKAYIDLNGYSKIGMLLNENFPKLLEAAGNSHRFGSVKISHVIDDTCDETIVQFAAMTFHVAEDIAFIAFRGTDDSLVGWKEDFMMSIMDTVPAQEKALSYLTSVVADLPSNQFYVGGHSKGGNLAVFAAVFSNTTVQNQLIQIYNNDGPGFKTSLLDSKAYEHVAPRIRTLVPKSSIVGMLLEHEESYDVVQCTIKQSGLLQHDGFTWIVKGTSFIHLEDVDRESKFLSKTIKAVLNNMTIEQREAFTYAFFDILSANEQKSLLDIQNGQLKSIVAMVKAYDGLDKVTRKALRDVYRLMFAEGFKQIWSKKEV